MVVEPLAGVLEGAVPELDDDEMAPEPGELPVGELAPPLLLPGSAVPLLDIAPPPPADGAGSLPFGG